VTILLIRHGETALNVARVLQPAATELSDRGIAQADALAARLVRMEVRAILSSDLPRALRTAQAIAATTGAPIELTPLLQERNFGDWRGLPYDGLMRDPLTMTDAPPNGESATAFAQRAAAAFALAVRRRAALGDEHGGALAVVTHGLVLRVLLATQVRLADGMHAPAHLGNTSLSIVEARPPHLVSLLNCTRHVDGIAADDGQGLSGG
jgi:probable phosphoglycerate mutase